jgi:hypothetical protein
MLKDSSQPSTYPAPTRSTGARRAGRLPARNIHSQSVYSSRPARRMGTDQVLTEQECELPPLPTDDTVNPRIKRRARSCPGVV